MCLSLHDVKSEHNETFCLSINSSIFTHSQVMHSLQRFFKFFYNLKLTVLQIYFKEKKLKKLIYNSQSS